MLVAAMADVHRRLPSARLPLVGDGPLGDARSQPKDERSGSEDIVRMPGRAGRCRRI